MAELGLATDEPTAELRTTVLARGTPVVLVSKEALPSVSDGVEEADLAGSLSSVARLMEDDRLDPRGVADLYSTCGPDSCPG